MKLKTMQDLKEEFSKVKKILKKIKLKIWKCTAP
jgi:hypothetical protein